VINLYYGSAIVVNQLVLILLSYSMTGLVLLERMGYERFRAAAWERSLKTFWVLFCLYSPFGVIQQSLSQNLLTGYEPEEPELQHTLKLCV
jgi:uncharacterized membrane protein YeiB